MSGKPFVVKHIGSEDARCFAVVEPGEGFEGKWKRRCLFVLAWYETEDQARAHAHSMLFPDHAA